VNVSWCKRMRATNRTFQFCTEAVNDCSCNFTAVCLQGVEINSAQRQPLLSATTVYTRAVISCGTHVFLFASKHNFVAQWLVDLRTDVIVV